ncbi:uncharacterized protein PAC_00277 [Phialocephala subalpina]|uniref:Uncharacterized protein n=1 Tax=Phialocephala subalpina TaxID=576137 RepID=A0A1L7WC96_9HELO|nr:uncharacterized protein PAC_00277 [Phialocephala subalpina]
MVPIGPDHHICAGACEFHTFFTLTRQGEYEGYLRNFYAIWTEADARDTDDKRIKCNDPEGIERDFATVVSFEWPEPPEGQEDITPSIGWECIAAIMAHHVSISFAEDGEHLSNKKYLENLAAIMNPLSSMGCSGWPGVTRLQGEMKPGWAFRQGS